MHNSAPHHALLGSKAAAKSKWRGYVELTRLHKSVLGNTLMFWPCGRSLSPQSCRHWLIDVTAWGLTMAAYAVGSPLRDLGIQLLVFGIGSTLLHSAACVLNDICDIDFDRLVGESLQDDLRPTLTPRHRAHAVAAAARGDCNRPRGMDSPRPAHRPDNGDVAPDEPDGVSAIPSFLPLFSAVASIPMR